MQFVVNREWGGLPAQDAPGLDAGDLAYRDPRDAMSLQTAWLRSFLAVADKSGFGAATLVLHLSQSRVSAHIAALEHALGVSLFDRKARPVCMTEAGELFRGHALTALLELQSGVFAFKDAWGVKRMGQKRLECALTIRDGALVYDRDGRGFPVWTTAGVYGTIP